jgi:TRAP-type C4-dicarboxylate transport system permease large subunit
MIISSLQDSLNITCKLLLILIGVGVFGYFLAATRLPFALADFVTGLPINRYFIFAGVIIFFIVLGCLLNVIPMILLVLPTIFPAITALGFVPMEDIFRGIFPFFLCMIACVVLLVIFPQIALYLPNLLFN